MNDLKIPFVIFIFGLIMFVWGLSSTLKVPLKPCEPVAVPDATDWRPNLRDCPDGVSLWVCIRDAMHRRDI